MRASAALSLLLAVVVAACGNAASPGASRPASPGATGAGPPSGTPGAPTAEVRVFLVPRGVDPCGTVAPVVRQVAGPVDVAVALRELLRGPTGAEAAAGFTSLFGPATADALLDVRIVEGIAHASFRDLRAAIPNASSSCGSAALLAALDATLAAVPGVRGARYSFGGDEAAFYEWLQMSPPD